MWLLIVQICITCSWHHLSLLFHGGAGWCEKNTEFCRVFLPKPCSQDMFFLFGLQEHVHDTHNQIRPWLFAVVSQVQSLWVPLVQLKMYHQVIATWSAKVLSPVQRVCVSLGQLKLHRQYTDYGCHLVSWRCITSIEWVPLVQLKMYTGRIGVTCSAEVWSPVHQYSKYGCHLVSLSDITSTQSMGVTWSAEVWSPVQKVWVPLGQRKLYHQYREYVCHLISWNCIASTRTIGATWWAEGVSPV